MKVVSLVMTISTFHHRIQNINFSTFRVREKVDLTFYRNVARRSIGRVYNASTTNPLFRNPVVSVTNTIIDRSYLQRVSSGVTRGRSRADIGPKAQLRIGYCTGIKKKKSFRRERQGK